MTNAPRRAVPPSVAPSSKGAAFALYVAAVLSVAMILFPPFTSINGTEYAFLLTGPEWARVVRTASDEPGLTARIYWPALLVQLGAVWAIALGARWFLGRRPPGPKASALLLSGLLLLLTPEILGVLPRF